jgi:hypothetical protein
MTQFHVTDTMGNLPMQSDLTLADIPSEMVYKLAVGLEEPDHIAEFYGVPEEKWTHLKAWPPLLKAVMAERSKLEAEGVTFKYKMRLLAEDSIEHAYRIAKSSNTPLPQVLEFAKLAAKLADMEPRQDRNVASGPGFSININLGGQTVSLSATKPLPPADVIDVEPNNE